MHASAIMRTIGRAIEGAEQLHEVLPMLTRLGRTHANLFVKQDYFAVLRECLVEALAEHLGREILTDSVKDAWRVALDGIAAVIVSNYPDDPPSSSVVFPEDAKLETL